MESEPPAETEENRQQPVVPASQTPGARESTPGEVRVRFGLYGAGVMMVTCFLVQAVFNLTPNQTQRITELGILMGIGFVLGWGFARIRF